MLTALSVVFPCCVTRKCDTRQLVVGFLLQCSVLEWMGMLRTLHAALSLFPLPGVCRLGMMWPGVEPQKGQYNFTYLKVARDITNK